MTTDKIRCEAAASKTSAKMWAIMISSIVAVIILDVILTPHEFVGLVSLVFASAIVVIFALITRDVKKTCNVDRDDS